MGFSLALQSFLWLQTANWKCSCNCIKFRNVRAIEKRPLFELNNNYAGFVAYSISTYIIHWSDQIGSSVLARRFWNEEYFWGKLYFCYFAHTNLLLRVLECSTTPRMQLRSGVREKWFSAKINIYGMYICLYNYCVLTSCRYIGAAAGWVRVIYCSRQMPG